MGSSSLGRYKSGRYVLNNGNAKQVGFLFNLYDTFISGKDRIIHIKVPRNPDYNQMELKFDYGC